MDKGGKINLYGEMLYPNYGKTNKYYHDINNPDSLYFHNGINPKNNIGQYKTQRYLYSNYMYPSEANYNNKYNDYNYLYPINETIYSPYPINNNFNNYTDEINFYKRQINRLKQREKYRRLINTILNKQKKNNSNPKTNEHTKELRSPVISNTITNRNKMRNSETFNFNTNTNLADYYKNLGMKLKISNYQTKTGTVYANRTNFLENLYKNNLNFNDDKKNYSKLNPESTYSINNKTNIENYFFDDYNTNITRNTKKFQPYLNEEYYNDSYENDYDNEDDENNIANEESINNSYLNKYDNLVNENLQKTDKKIRNDIGKSIKKEYEEQEIQIIRIHQFIMHLEILFVVSIKKNFDLLITNMKYFIDQKIKRTHQLLKRFATKKKPNHYVKINNQDSNQLNTSCKKTTIYSTSNKKNRTIGYFKENKTTYNDNNLNETAVYVPKKNIVQNKKIENKYLGQYNAYNKCIKKLMKIKNANNSKENNVNNTTTNRRIKSRRFVIGSELNNTTSKELDLNNTNFNDSVLNNISNQNKSCKSFKGKEIIYSKKKYKIISSYSNKINNQNNSISPEFSKNMLYSKKNTNKNKTLTSKNTAVFIKPFAKNISNNQSTFYVKKNNQLTKNMSFENTFNNNGTDNNMTQQINFKKSNFLLRSPICKKISNPNSIMKNDINIYDNDIQEKLNIIIIKDIHTYDNRLTIIIKYANFNNDTKNLNKKRFQKKFINRVNNKIFLNYKKDVLKIVLTDSIEYLAPLNVVRTVVLLDLDTFDDKTEEIDSFKSGFMNNLYNDKNCLNFKNLASGNGKILQVNKPNELKINIADNNNLFDNDNINHDELLNNSNEEEKRKIFNETNISKLIKIISHLIYKYFFNHLLKTSNSSNMNSSQKTPVFSKLNKLNQEKFNKNDDKSYSSNYINSQKSLPEFTEVQSISSGKSRSSSKENQQKLDEVADIKINPFNQENFSSKTVNNDLKFKHKSIANSTNTSHYSKINEENDFSASSYNYINRKKALNIQLKKIKLKKEDKKNTINEIYKRNTIKYLMLKITIKPYFNKWKLIKNNKGKKFNKKMRQLTLNPNKKINDKKINNELYQDIKDKIRLFRLILINFSLLKGANKNLGSISDDLD